MPDPGLRRYSRVMFPMMRSADGSNGATFQVIAINRPSACPGEDEPRQAMPPIVSRRSDTIRCRQTPYDGRRLGNGPAGVRSHDQLSDEVLRHEVALSAVEL
ncbi:hypothetical protein LPU83_pLPU83d_1311 (plasmid) [Rhizobium favelukesii]|uniref:Uncharacterized protein n=1 Tax=Rhizobium favelukesii TaxID=348824 RepID=W6S976_9HYPH|nr:hypothetical protein LPU83_pLPU83d_1311 [Rhizobium favelukesii]